MSNYWLWDVMECRLLSARGRLVAAVMSTGEYTVSVTKVLDQAELLADFWTKEG